MQSTVRIQFRVIEHLGAGSDAVIYLLGVSVGFWSRPGLGLGLGDFQDFRSEPSKNLRIGAKQGHDGFSTLKYQVYGVLEKG